MKNLKRFTILTIFVFILIFLQQNNTNDTTITNSGKLNHKVTDDLSKYSISFKDCNIKWTIASSKISINVANSKNKKCSISFKEQIKYHKQILQSIVKNHDLNSISSVHTESMFYINPTGEWNKSIIKAAQKSKDLEIYKKRYPAHPKEIKLNEIFIDIFNSTDIPSKLSEIFLDYGFSLELLKCEKVLNGNRGRIAMFGISLSRFGTMIYDAGNFSFKLKSLN